MRWEGEIPKGGAKFLGHVPPQGGNIPRNFALLGAKFQEYCPPREGGVNFLGGGGNFL